MGEQRPTVVSVQFSFAPGRLRLQPWLNERRCASIGAVNAAGFAR